MKVYRYRHTQRSQRDTHNATRSCHAGQNCTVEHREPAAATIHIAHRLDLPKHRNSINTNRNNAYVNIGLTNISSVFTNIINNHRCFFCLQPGFESATFRVTIDRVTTGPPDPAKDSIWRSAAHLDDVEDDGSDEHAVELETVIAEDVVETASAAVLGQHADGARVNRRTNERIQMVIAHLTNLTYTQRHLVFTKRTVRVETWSAENPSVAWVAARQRSSDPRRKTDAEGTYTDSGDGTYVMYEQSVMEIKCIYTASQKRVPPYPWL